MDDRARAALPRSPPLLRARRGRHVRRGALRRRGGHRHDGKGPGAAAAVSSVRSAGRRRAADPRAGRRGGVRRVAEDAPRGGACGLVTLQHRLEYAVVMTFRGALRVLPMRGAIAVGTLLGRAFHAFDAAHRRLALKNLEAAFPARSPGERAALAREMFAHFGRLLAVLLKFSTMTPAQMLACVEFEGEERVRAAHGLGRGVLLFTGHFGYWEINALVHALALQPMAVLARPLDNPLLHALLASVRCSTGNPVI